MDRLFLQIVNMSVTSCYVILFVIAARLLLKKTPKIFSYVLWSVVLFRLICPFSFESIFSLVPVNTQAVPTNIMDSQIPQINSGITVIDKVVNNNLPTTVASVSTHPMQIWITLGKAVWLIGILVLLIYSTFTVIRLYLKIKSKRPVFDNVYEVNGIKTPFVFGLFKSKIYLPTNLSENERAYIIKHEQTHIKRFDHIIKPFAFMVLCVHWFNPLAWVAFFLFSEDMELSCDESVIKQMGINIKKDYSTSLLSLSIGRRIIGGCPLPFGENNTKGRIINILNYKKPTFWVVAAAVIIVVVVCVGLMSNPQNEQLTVEDYAEQFMNQEIENYENAEWTDVKIIDSKIIKFEKVTSFDSLYSLPLEIWSLEYRFKPDDMSKAPLPGGMNAIDGWITEDASMGKPMLIFSYEGSKPQYLGCIRSGEGDFTTLAGQETMLRRFLESMDVLPHETYSGNHIVVKFPLSTGETCQLFLSQPVVQGNKGIWCVERWIDGNENLYYVTPKTDIMPIDYYKELQKQCDEGHKVSLLDPLQVALDYITNEVGLGQRLVKFDDLSPQYSATVEDFEQVPESHFIGFITKYNVEWSQFHLDKIEWLTLDDEERLKELNIDPNDLSNGYYIYNPDSYPMTFEVTDKTQFNIINKEVEATHKSVTMEEFIHYLNQYLNYEVPPEAVTSNTRPIFRIVTKGWDVQSITEQYVP